MKNLLIISLLLISCNILGQNTKATTDDGKRVLLKENGTWEYIQEQKDYSKFVEPKGDPKIQDFLKNTGSTIQDMKKHVSIDSGCSVDKIILLEVSEQLGNAIYVLDVCGEKMKYRRVGSAFFKDGEKPALLGQ